MVTGTLKMRRSRQNSNRSGTVFRLFLPLSEPGFVGQATHAGEAASYPWYGQG
jgi:hypothetical protein